MRRALPRSKRAVSRPFRHAQRAVLGDLRAHFLDLHVEELLHRFADLQLVRVAIDLELEVATTHRQACWTTWLDRYTYGQSRDRLEYARRRVRAFAGGDVDRPQLRLGELAISPVSMPQQASRFDISVTS